MYHVYDLFTICETCAVTMVGRYDDPQWTNQSLVLCV